MNKVRNIEELSADMLNEDFIKIFQPIFIVLRILGLLRVNIKYRYPTAPSIWYYLYSNVFWILNTFCGVYVFLQCENSIGSRYADSTLKFGVLINGISGVLTVGRNNFRKENKLGQMYVKLQKIERYLNMENVKSLNKQLGRQSTFIILSACLVTIFWIILFKTVLIWNVCIPFLIVMSTGLGLHLAMTEAYFIIRLITTRVNYINVHLRQETSGANEPLKKSINDGKLFFVMNTSENHVNRVPGEFVSAMCCIFAVLSEFTELFQFSIFYFVCQALIWNLVSIHYLVTSYKEQKIADFDLLLCVIPLLLIKQIIIMKLCHVTETLSTKLEESRKLCINIVSSSLDDGKSRDHAKQVMLLVEGRRNVSIYNICTLGTRLPLHLLAITASYTIVLLQFALL